MPGAVLEIIRLDKSMLLKRNSYKATPLLPDGSTPRVSVGSRYLGIPAIEGRYPQDADGRVKVTRRASNQGIKGDQSIDGIYDTKPNTRGSSTAEHIPSKMSDGTDPGHDSNSTSHDGAGDEVKNWLDNYNAGTQLTQNRHGVLCISFDENIRRDAVRMWALLRNLRGLANNIYSSGRDIYFDAAPFAYKINGV